MAIQEGDFITINYVGKMTSDESVFDTTRKEVAEENDIYNAKSTYGGDVIIVGAGQTIAGLDEDFIGKEVGYTGTVTIQPEKAFGEHKTELVKSYSISRFKEMEEPLRPGLRVLIDGVSGIINKIIGRRVRVDFNNVLAGETLEYEYSIDGLIEGDVAKVEGMMSLYTGTETEVNIDDKVISINVPVGLTFEQRWLMGKARVAHEIMERIGAETVSFVDTYNKSDFTPEGEGAEE